MPRPRSRNMLGACEEQGGCSERRRRGGRAGSAGALGPRTERGCSLQMHELPVEGFKQKVMGSDLWCQRPSGCPAWAAGVAVSEAGMEEFMCNNRPSLSPPPRGQSAPSPPPQKAPEEASRKPGSSAEPCSSRPPAPRSWSPIPDALQLGPSATAGCALFRALSGPQSP